METLGSLRRSVRGAALIIMASIAVIAAPARTTVTVGSNGLISLRYGSTEFLASGDLRVHTLRFATPSASDAADLQGTVTTDPRAQQVVTTFRWGSITATYRPRGDRVDVVLLVSNRSTVAMEAIGLEPLTLRLPSRPREYDGVTPLIAYDAGEPAVIPLHYAEGTLVLASEDLGAPLLFGLPWSINGPAHTEFPLHVGAALHSSYPDSYPRLSRRIPAGGSDRFMFSLRFGPPEMSPEILAADLYGRFARSFPSLLRWPDRRPIGQLVLATSVAGWSTNPRGWLLDPTIDVTTPAGLVAFRAAILAWADRSVAILKNIGAQGMIAWDIEGEEFPHPTTYLCDPRVVGQTAPEMDAIADEFFRRFTSAGLRVGVCVRPQRLALGQGSAAQLPAADPAQLMIDKIAYARSRWGASIFYVDSNGMPGLPMDAAIFQRVLKAHPDILLVPEHENLRYYAYSAPYRELRQNQPGTPAWVRWVYPQAFGLTYVADGDFTLHMAPLSDAVAHGEVLLTRSWYPDPANEQVSLLYQRFGPRRPSDRRVLH